MRLKLAAGESGIIGCNRVWKSEESGSSNVLLVIHTLMQHTHNLDGTIIGEAVEDDMLALRIFAVSGANVIASFAAVWMFSEINKPLH